MRPSADLEGRAFQGLRRHLARRRLQQLDLRLRIELALLALLLTSFVFWQIRGPLASLHAEGGANSVWTTLAAIWASVALLVAGAVALRHARRLRRAPPGPAWLALPVSSGALARHLAWDSKLIAGWVAVPALGAWMAALGLVPTLWLLAWVVPVIGSLLGCSRAGAALGERLAAWGLPPAAAATGVVRVLAAAPTREVGRKLAPARWTAAPKWLALCAKDMCVTRRVGAVRRHLLAALVLWGLSALAWRTPSPSAGMRDLAYVAAFVLALLGSAALGEWLVALSGSDPFAAVRTLPIGVATVWGARFAWAILATGLLLLIHALAAQGLSHGPRHLFLAWLGAATLAVATLGVNYGVTLFPREDLARRLLGLSLGLAVAASLMIPLLGWVVLLAAVLHSARRLPYWSRLEEA